MSETPGRRVEQISKEVVRLLGTAQQVEPLSRRLPGFDLAEAYAVVHRVRDMRMARGENPVGRKIGFTNRAVWSDYAISAPIWNYVFDRTVSEASDRQTELEFSRMPEPRIEPEIVLHLAIPPEPGMSNAGLIECIDWVCAGFEVVYSIFPDWAFSAADAAAAYGCHGALILGEKLVLTHPRSEHTNALSTFTVELANDRGIDRQGHAENILGGPLEALKFLVEEIVRYPACEPLRAGELITTGSLTEAMPATSGETWTVRFQGINLTPLQLRF